MSTYNHKSVEERWQQHWLENKVFRASGDSSKPKYYALDMFPYPSGAGLHVGHPLGYTATDIICRKKRQEGFEVLHPMGWDAFGLPAENYAIKTGVHPSKSTNENIDNFRRQIQSLGFSYDWDREISTTDPDYYKWTQWLFLQFYNRGLLYEKEQAMNWCPKCKVVVANEEVEEGKHERCGEGVEKRDLKQWMFRITDYAERLLQDLNTPNVHIFHGWLGSKNENWFPWAKQQFEAIGCNVHTLDFPDQNEPVYEDWKEHFEAEAPEVWPQDVFIGHSLGGTLALKLIADNNYHIDHLILVAPTPDITILQELEDFFHLDMNCEKIKKLVNKITFFCSNNDEYISLKKFKKLAAKLDVSVTLIRDRGHINQKEFPELLDIVNEMHLHILDWPEKIKAMQRNWIGRSEGVNFKNKVKDMDIEFEVYNSVPQTYYAETFTGIAPEHPLVKELVKGTDKEEEVMAFVEKIKKEKMEKKFDIENDLKGIFTGRYVENFAGTGHDLPIWVASYIVADYGTGIVNCSAHDERDFAFAKEHDIELRPVMFPAHKGEAEKVRNCEYAYAKDPHGIMELCPDEFKGRMWGEVREDIIDYVVEQGFGTRQVNYKLRDWIFTRQRYWGEPIPLVFDEEGNCYPLDESQLPLLLPETPNYEPTDSGESPLSNIDEWVNVQGYITKEGTVIVTNEAPKKEKLQKFRRETSTMPNWAGSNWYWLRFMDAQNDDFFCSKKAEQYWGPVDLYVGGAEHAVLHLLYARFWHKVLYDMGLVSSREPFKKLVNQGLILAEDGTKMSKSLGNVVNPDEIVEKYGADTLRMYEMFMGPFEQSKMWNTAAVDGMYKFVCKIWRIYTETSLVDTDPSNEMWTIYHQTVKKVSEDINHFKFNTALSQFMIFFNEASKWEAFPRAIAEGICVMLSSFAPHIAEELWHEVLGHRETITYASWPEYDEQYLVEDMVTYAVQVNGKLRGDFKIAKGSSKEEVIEAAKQIEKVAKYLEGGMILKEIFVPDKIVGFVVNVRHSE